MGFPDLSVGVAKGRYDEMIVAEHNYNCLKKLIAIRAKEYGSIKYEELKLLHEFLNVEQKESEDTE